MNLAKLQDGSIRKKLSVSEDRWAVLVDFGPSLNAKMNLFCTDSMMEIVWCAESIDGTPYVDFVIENGRLFAFSFGGWRVEVDIFKGKVLNKDFVR